MRIVSYEEIGQAAWDDFCAHSDDAWFLHTSDWLEYSLAYSLGSEVCGFAVVQNGAIQAICPLILEKVILYERQFFQLSYGGAPCPMPCFRNDLGVNNRAKILNTIMEHIDALAFEKKMARCLIRFNVLSSNYLGNYNIPFNFLIKYGFLDACMYSQLLPLASSEADILRSMRKGHRHSIKRARNEIEVEIFDWQNITADVFGEYQDLHAKAAGRKTRSQSTFDMMYNWIKDRKSLLCGARSNGKYVGFAMAFVYKEGSLYASACNDPDYTGNAVGQVIQWRLISYLKSKGIKSYELGIQYWGNQINEVPDSKALSIANFKRGFGGITVPVFWGEKYYDSNLFELVYSNRIRAYKQNQFTNEGSTT